jgi:hypothetical protein
MEERKQNQAESDSKEKVSITYGKDMSLTDWLNSLPKGGTFRVYDRRDRENKED